MGDIMKDKRISELAYKLLTYSCNLQKGEKVYISAKGLESLDLVKELVKQTIDLGGVPFFYYEDHSIMRNLLMNVSEEQMKAFTAIHKPIMEAVDCFIGIRAPDNMFDLSDIPADKMDLYSKIYVDDVHMNVRLSKKWVILNYPTNSTAQLAKMSKDAYEDLFFKVCCLDYSKMDKAMDNLKVLMEKTDKVRIVSPANKTDLTFSIKGLPAIKCSGERNIPDGEIYTAPVRASINGTILFNTETMEEGKYFKNIFITFENGKAVKAECENDTAGLNEILDKDEGARFVGEFSFGVNPFITKPLCDILFDEKITGSIHMALGAAYDDCNNGNKSVNHWDMIHIQTPDFGGGEIYFDDVLIRKDGLFVLPELECLNPKSLM